MVDTLHQLASIGAVALAATLVWAAVAKLRTPLETAANFEQLGVPQPLLMARVVPAVEMAVALLLVFLPGWGGVAAFVMLVGFTVLLASLVRSGETIACSCFGAVSDEPISRVEVARNIVLLAAAAAAATIDQLTTPTFPGIVAFSALAIIAAVGVQLVAFQRDVGTIWSTTLAGEIGRTDSRTNTGATA